MIIDTAVIPVAGRGTRLLPLTKSQPKEMLPLAQKVVVQYVVEELVRAGAKRMLLVTGSGKDSIENHFDIDHNLIQFLRHAGQEKLLASLEFERIDAEYFYTRQQEPLGLGHAVLCAKSYVKDQPFILALGDSILGLHGKSKSVNRLCEMFTEHQADAVIAFEKVTGPEISQYGVAQPLDWLSKDCFTLQDVVEKPRFEEAPSSLAIAGRYVLSPKIFQALEQTRPGKGGEIHLTDALRNLCHGQHKVMGLVLDQEDRRFDIGNFSSYYRAFVEFALNDPNFGTDLRAFTRSLLSELPKD